MVAEFHDRPFGSRGEMLAPPPSAPPPPAPQAFVIPPPDWAAEERERDAANRSRVSDSEGPQMSAIEKMMADALERGEIDEPAPLGPPVQVQPLQRFVPPEPDWNEVEREATARNRRERRQHALDVLNEEETPARFPPPQRGAA
jgi:hypothetical protein